MQEIIKQKLTSRKLWMAVACFVSMLMIHLGADAESAESVAALILAAFTVIGYVVGEGISDAGETIVENVEVVGEKEITLDIEEMVKAALKNIDLNVTVKEAKVQEDEEE